MGLFTINVNIQGNKTENITFVMDRLGYGKKTWIEMENCKQWTNSKNNITIQCDAEKWSDYSLRIRNIHNNKTQKIKERWNPNKILSCYRKHAIQSLKITPEFAKLHITWRTNRWDDEYIIKYNITIKNKNYIMHQEIFNGPFCSDGCSIKIKVSACKVYNICIQAVFQRFSKYLCKQTQMQCIKKTQKNFSLLWIPTIIITILIMTVVIAVYIYKYKTKTEIKKESKNKCDQLLNEMVKDPIYEIIRF